MFEMSWHMVGLEKFMVDMAMGEEYIEVLLERGVSFARPSASDWWNSASTVSGSATISAPRMVC